MTDYLSSYNINKPQTVRFEDFKKAVNKNNKSKKDTAVNASSASSQTVPIEQPQQIIIPNNLEQDTFEPKRPAVSPNVKTFAKSVAVGVATMSIVMFIMSIVDGKRLRKQGSQLEMDKKKLAEIWDDLSDALKIKEMALPKNLKKSLEEIKLNISNQDVIKRKGGGTVKSILLYGPPGTGKTTYAKALAKEFPDAKFASLDVTSLGSEYRSVTERNLNKAVDAICEQAKNNPNKKIIVFIDEIDSVMMVDRGSGAHTSNNLLNEFKKCFTEKLGKNDNVITVGATNLEIDTKKAMLADGKKLDRPMLDRFDRKIYVGLPIKEQLVEAVTSFYKKIENPLVETELMNADSKRLNILCDFLSQKHHNTSFRTLNSLFREASTVSTIRGREQKVSIEDFYNVLISKKDSMNISDAELKKLADALNIK